MEVEREVVHSLQRELTHFVCVSVLHTWMFSSDWECLRGCKTNVVCGGRTVAIAAL